MKNSFWFRMKRKITTLLIKNNIVKEAYKQDVAYKYLYKKYFKVINNHKYNDISNNDTKIIWVCWFQGLDNAPEIVKVCYEKLTNTFKDYKIILITDQNYSDYVNIPKYIVDKWKSGLINHTHFSDILRVFLLADNGGIWMDSTVYTTAKEIPSYISENPFFVYKNIKLDRSDEFPIVASSWLIKSNKNNPIMLLTKDLICEYWKESNVLIDYYLFHIFFAIASRKYYEMWENVPTYNNVNPHIMMFELFKDYDKKRFDFYKSISDFHKLTYKFKDSEITKKTNIYHILRGEK